VAGGRGRELAEELSLRLTPGRLLVVDWAPHPAEGDKLLFVFDGGRLTSSETTLLRPHGDGIAEARYFGARTSSTTLRRHASLLCCAWHSPHGRADRRSTPNEELGPSLRRCREPVLSLDVSLF
jgi:hypothetical protein